MSASSLSLIPPGPGGVRDYAALLGPALGAPLFELAADTPVAGLSGPLLCVHFSGYGYQKRGLPTWLLHTLREMKPRFGKLGIVFHELFAVGPPWGSAFWLSGMQRRLARDLLGLADFWLTSRESSARWLLDTRIQPAPHRVLPVFSNVGEPASIDSPREDRIVVFGSQGVRANVYEWNDGEVFRHASRQGLQLHDIGPSFAPGSALAKRLAEQGAVAHGKLDSAEVSALLSSAKFGAATYPIDAVAKSSVFAAYCAHGLCPILLSRDYGAHDGLVRDRHYASGFDAAARGSLDPLQIGREARAWYEPHGISMHQAAIRALAEEAR